MSLLQFISIYFTFNLINFPLIEKNSFSFLIVIDLFSEKI